MLIWLSSCVHLSFFKHVQNKTWICDLSICPNLDISPRKENMGFAKHPPGLQQIDLSAARPRSILPITLGALWQEPPQNSTLQSPSCSNLSYSSLSHLKKRCPFHKLRPISCPFGPRAVFLSKEQRRPNGVALRDLR